MFGRVDFREDGKKEKKKRKNKKWKLFGGYLVRRKRGKKIIESMCFFPESTRRFSSQNGEKTVKKTGPIIWTKMSLQRSSLLVLLNIFLSYFSLFSINVQSFYYLLFIYFLGTVQRSIPNQLDFWLFILFLFSFFPQFFFFFTSSVLGSLYIYIYIYIY